MKTSPSALTLLQVAEETYRQLLGDDFDSIIPVHSTRAVDALLWRWYQARMQLDRLQWQQQQVTARQAAAAAGEAAAAEGGQRLVTAGGSSKPTKAAATRRQRKAAQLAAQADKLESAVAKVEVKLSELQREVEEEQAVSAAALPAPCFFATFRTMAAAMFASRLNLNPRHERMMRCAAARAWACAGAGQLG